jgi:hypothetical protein
MAWTQEQRDSYKAKLKKNKLDRAARLEKANSRTEQGKRELIKLIEEKRAVVVFQPTTLDDMLRGIGKTKWDCKCVAMGYVKLLSDTYSKFEDMAKAWDALTPAKQKATSLDALCEAAGVPVSEFLARVAPKAHEIGSNLAKMFVGMAQPHMVKRSIEAGMESDGFRDRQMILQSGGIAPSPKGINVNVQQNNQQNNVSESALPDFDSDCIDLVATVRE